MPERLIKDIAEFNKYVKFYRDSKADFRTEISGTTKRLIAGDRIYRYVNVRASRGQGFHITKQVKKDINAYIEENEVPNYTNDYLEQFYDLHALEKSMGRLSMAVDITNCYWVTIRKLGYIKETTYIKGLRDKRWKVGRNASIGTLAKTTVIYPHIGGRKQTNKRQIIQPQQEYLSIRNHVIGHVYTLFYKLKELLGEDFIMFLTDCVFINPKRLKEVHQFLDSYGYEYSQTPITFLHHDKKNRTIYWDDMTRKKLETGRRKPKYNIYNKRQTVENDLPLIKPIIKL